MKAAGLGKLGLLLPAAVGMAAAAAADDAGYLFNDSHFHLTNYVQEGTDVRNYVEIMGDKGGARVHIKDYAKVGDVGLFTDLNGSMVDVSPRLYEQHEHGRIIQKFLDSITTGEPMSPSGEEGLERVKVIDWIYRSAEEQRELQVAAAPATVAVS